MMKNLVQLVARAVMPFLMVSLVACPGNSGGGNGAYRIELRYSADFPPRFKPAFEAAAQRWQSIITADVPDVGGTIDPNVCGVSGQAPLNRVDDLIIYAGIIPFDAGNPDLLGQAGPCYFRKTSFLTIVGTMAFVDNKMDGLLQANQLTDTVTHEMGHVLGIGTHWNNVPNIATGLSNDQTQCGTNPEFIGVNAVREYRALGGTGNITIENQGGPGTCDGHWKESIFGAELMTGVLNNGVPNPLSRITLGSMQDLGYSVDLSKANSYSISAFGGSTLRIRNQLIVTRPVERELP
jgi:Leishmanolysin